MQDDRKLKYSNQINSIAKLIRKYVFYKHLNYSIIQRMHYSSEYYIQSRLPLQWSLDRFVFKWLYEATEVLHQMPKQLSKQQQGNFPKGARSRRGQEGRGGGHAGPFCGSLVPVYCEDGTKHTKVILWRNSPGGQVLIQPCGELVKEKFQCLFENNNYCY